MTEDGRLVTLVVCDGEERVLGQLAPFRVSDPWWQEVRSIEDRRPGVTVLRVLGGTPTRWGHYGGSVTYLAEATGAARVEGLGSWEGALADDGHRMPWARAGGPTADLRWATSSLEENGWSTETPVHHRTWNLSSIWELPMAGARAWLKCVPPFFAHEATVLNHLQEEAVPRLLAADAHRILLASMPGVDGYDASLPDQLSLIELLVDLQARTVTQTDRLLAEGVPSAQAGRLVTQLADLVARRAPDDLRLRRVLDEATERFDEIGRCGLPDVLVHGDAHPGNARIGCKPFMWFDWGDSRIGNPLLDLAVLERAPADARPVLERHWLDAWREAVPGSDPHRCWTLLRPYALARMGAVYQTFLDAIEVAERTYHEADVLPALEAAARAVAHEGG